LIESEPSYLKYGGADHPALPTTILVSANRIKLYHQAKFDASPLEEIQLRIGEAETICFLGFGFYPMNIKLLQFCRLGINTKTRVYASAYGMYQGEEEAARQALGFEIQFAPVTFKCLDALRYFPILIAT
jgi:hypothetical protein